MLPVLFFAVLLLLMQVTLLITTIQAWITSLGWFWLPDADVVGVVLLREMCP